MLEENVRLLSHVFAGKDQQSEWLKLDESRSVYCFWDKILIFSLFVRCLYRKGPAFNNYATCNL